MPNGQRAERSRASLAEGFVSRLRRAKRHDRTARWIVTAGGLTIIVSVILIMATLIAQAYPLATPASGGERLTTADLGAPSLRAYRSWSSADRKLLATLDGDGIMRWTDAAGETHETPLPRFSGKVEAVSRPSVPSEMVTIVSDNGTVFTYQVKFQLKPGSYDSELAVRKRANWSWPFEGEPPLELSASRNSDGTYIAAAILPSGQAVFTAVDDDDDEYSGNLTDLIEGATAIHVAVNDPGSRIAVALDGGRVAIVNVEDIEEPDLRQVLNASKRGVTAVGWVLGGQTLVVGDANGDVSTWLEVPDTKAPRGRRWELLHDIDNVGSPVRAIVPATRTKTFFVVAQNGDITAMHATTARALFTVKKSASADNVVTLAPRDNGIITTTPATGATQVLAVHNEHPETTLYTLFARVWYEGYRSPRFVWQSTGGEDTFEPKLSLVPLIFGTFKATFYALIFAIPNAVLAALFTSQFAPSRMATIVKPIVELMAGIPSVVIGFLAALWLAPLMEQILIGFAIFPIVSIVVIAVCIAVWRRVPLRIRVPYGPQAELGIAAIALIVAAFSAYALGPMIEDVAFGGDFRQWLFTVTGMTYAQRNCIVVGFALGFAVLPIIFTICEDAFNNVPQSLVAASLALGATRWQTAYKIVLPAARAGVFAAILLGMGRAVGETMIVLMATGNTPILDWSPFNGMRTMSATIAVEAPEAPAGGTLYRVLFLTGALLFVFTFVTNSFSEYLSVRLRKEAGR